jgi:perosamine synthetase
MAVSEAISTAWLTQGPLVSKFEDALCQYLANNNRENHLRGAAVSSGSAALFLALKALDIGNGDEVLVPTYACSSLLNAVYLVGATPIILDISDIDFNPTVDMVSKKITDNTRALVLTHTFGVPTDTMAFKALGIRVIEDCAQSIGAKYRGENVGRLGDIATFSFFATKMITTGHGGMVVSDDTTLVERVRDYCNSVGSK